MNQHSCEVLAYGVDGAYANSVHFAALGILAIACVKVDVVPKKIQHTLASFACHIDRSGTSNEDRAVRNMSKRLSLDERVFSQPIV